MKFKKVIILLFLLIMFLQPINAASVTVDNYHVNLPKYYNLEAHDNTNHVLVNDFGLGVDGLDDGYVYLLNITDKKPTTTHYYEVDSYKGANNTLVFVLPTNDGRFLQISYYNNTVHDTNVPKNVCYTFAKMLKD